MKTLARALTGLQTAVAALAVVVIGCGSSPPSAHSAQSNLRPIEPARDSTALVPATARRPDPCNVRADEAKVGTQMIERGAALVFTTSGDVQALRQRVTDMAGLAPLPTVQPRLDNVRGGVRLVFETETAGDLAIIQRVVRERAREIAKACGLALAAEGQWAAAQQRDESSSEAAAHSHVSSEPGQNTPPARDQQKEPEADPSEATKPPAKPETKPEPAKQPKPENDPKDSDKPKDDNVPKDNEKPPVPPLPGLPPDPITPEPKG